MFSLGPQPMTVVFPVAEPVLEPMFGQRRGVTKMTNTLPLSLLFGYAPSLQSWRLQTGDC